MKWLKSVGISRNAEIYCQVFHVMPKCYERINVLIYMICLLGNFTQKIYQQNLACI